MPRTFICLLATATMLASGCAMTKAGAGSAASVPMSASATLLDPSSASRGRATVTQTDAGVRLTVDATGIAPGAHGFHIHHRTL